MELEGLDKIKSNWTYSFKEDILATTILLRNMAKKPLKSRDEINFPGLRSCIDVTEN